MHLTRCIFSPFFHHHSNQRIAHTAAMATFSNDYLPPEGFFETRDALFESINAYAKPRGYAFTTQRSIRGPNGFSRVFFACDRSRRPPSSPDRDRQRKTTTRMTNCPFPVLAKESSEGWTLKHRQDHRTEREPSAFEVVEAMRAKRPSQCTACGEIGHRRTSRVCPKRYSDIVRLD